MRESERLDVELERCILRGLACEYDQALEWIDDGLRRRMRRPLFVIADLRGRWGQWSASRREIALSRELVRGYPWGAVREVLRHEMAHQLAGVLDGDGGRPHGEAFHRACHLLRADPAATAGYRKIDDAGPSSRPLSDEDRLLVKVQKLFALADSPNANEAAAAMRKARQLMSRCGPHRDPSPWSGHYVSLLVGTPALRHFRPDYLLAQLLIDLYAVEGVWVPAFVLARGKMGRALEISGPPNRVQVAGYAHDFVRGFIDRQWRLYGARTAKGRLARRDFATGVLEGFRTRSVPAPEQEVAAGRSRSAEAALVPGNDPALKAYLRHRYPRLRHFHRRSGRRDDQAYADGLRTGAKLVIHEGIGTDAAPDVRPLRLTGCQRLP